VATSLLHAAEVATSLRSAGLLAIGVLAYCAITAAISTRERLVTAARWFLAAAAGSAVVGMFALAWHWATGSGWGIVRLETLAGFPAVMGVAFEHGVYGSVCAALSVASLSLWREGGVVITRSQAAAGFWLGAGGTLLSLSRGAWVAFVVGIAGVWLVRVRGGRSIAALLVWGALGLAAAGMAIGWFAGDATTDAGASTASAVGTQAGQVLAFGGSTGAQRLAEWRTSLQEVSTSPWLGLGTNSYGQRHVDRTQYGPKPAYVGNWAVRTLYDSGVIGLLLLAGFLGFSVWPGPVVRAAGGDTGAVARAFALAGSMLAVAYLATDALLLVWPWVAFGLSRSARVLAAEEASAGVPAAR
jgi:O-antigen ligase